MRKMTGLAAETFRLEGRGRIAPDMKADITVFDAGTILDRATYEAPTQSAQGIEHVFVNGGLAWTDGRPTCGRSGKFLSRSGAPG